MPGAGDTPKSNPSRHPRLRRGWTAASYVYSSEPIITRCRAACSLMLKAAGAAGRSTRDGVGRARCVCLDNGLRSRSGHNYCFTPPFAYVTFRPTLLGGLVDPPCCPHRVACH